MFVALKWSLVRSLGYVSLRRWYEGDLPTCVIERGGEGEKENMLEKNMWFPLWRPFWKNAPNGHNLDARHDLFKGLIDDGNHFGVKNEHELLTIIRSRSDIKRREQKSTFYFHP